MSLDKFTTSIDRDYKFIILAQDQFKLSSVTKNFIISVTTPNDKLYSNIFVKPFLKTNKRLELTEFFTNPQIFEIDKIYRPSDPAFGVQTELKMLLYAGIETKDAVYYASALGRSSKKRYRFGSVKKAIAKTPGTNDVIYEAVYIEVFDNMENSIGSLPKEINTRNLTLTNVPNKRTVGINYKDTRTITLNSVDDLWTGVYVIPPKGTDLVPENTTITAIDRKNKTIILDKDILSNIPAETNFTFDKGGIKVNQAKRDLWDSDITDDNIQVSSEDSLSRIWLQDKVMTADFDGQLISDLNKSNVFGNSTSNIRNKIKEIGETERNFLPLWMRTPQTFSGIEQGFIKGILLCYAKPGQADRIINNIKNLGIDFKKIDFTVDRVIIDSVKGQDGDKYIAFAAREIING